MPTAWPYCRVSTSDQNVEAQKMTIRAYHQYALSPKGFTLGEVYADADLVATTGAKPFLDRPSAGRLVRACERGDVIVAAKVDRAFRNTRDCLDTIDMLAKRGVGFHLLDLPVEDLTSAMGRLCLTMASAFAEFERRRMGERMKEFFRARKARGIPHPPHRRYGFKVVGSKGQKRYVPNVEQRAVGRLWLKWHEAGWGLDAIIYHWNEMVVAGKAPSGVISRRPSTATVWLWLLKERQLQAWEAAHGPATSPPGLDVRGRPVATAPSRTSDAPAPAPAGAGAAPAPAAPAGDESCGGL